MTEADVIKFGKQCHGGNVNFKPVSICCNREIKKNKFSKQQTWTLV